MKFQDGDYVIITKSASEYKKKYIGKTGTIESIFLTHDNITVYGVRFESLRNPISSKGLFWFRAESLSLTNPVNNLINESEEILMFQNYVVAKVQFLDNPVPVYSYAMYENYEPGTTVVVRTGSHGFALAKVHEVIESGFETFAEEKAKVTKGRQVVCRVDFSSYNARQEALKRATELQKQMDAKLREAQTMAIYEMFAEKDDSLKAMLEEFKSLSSQIKGESVSE